jgi:N-acyl-L-homoserine lactone synthetase
VFRYRIAVHGTYDFDRWRRLRTRLYLDTGLITPADIDPDAGVFVDVYDDHSVHLLAANEDGVDVGCLRMIEPGAGRTLPVTDLFDIDVLPHAWEVSGGAVEPKYRKSLIMLGFYRALFWLAEEREYQNMYAIVEQAVLDNALNSGLPVEVVSEPRFVFNALNVVTLIRRSSMVAAIESDSDDAPVFASYFRKPFDWTLSVDDLNPVG